MQWDNILARVKTALEGDARLVEIFGDAFRLAGSGEHTVPLCEWSLIANTERELWEPCTIQIDLWAPSFDLVADAERVVRRLFHQQLPVDLDGIQCFSQFLDGDTLASPDRDGYSGRAVRFRITPLREIYAPST